jgi:hypothetical protein
MPTAIEVSTCLQGNLRRSVKLEILDLNNNVINSIEGFAVDGSISISSQSAIRRSSDIKFILNSTTMINETSGLWINKRFRLYVGILNNLTNATIWYLQGTFILADPSKDIQINDRTVDIKGYDKYCLCDNTISGQLSNKITILVNTPISDSVLNTITTLGLESASMCLIDTSPYNTPYEIDQDVGGTVYDLIKTLQELYLTFKTYYDINGYFRFTKIKNGINDPIIFNFSNYNIIKNITQNYLYSNAKNYYKIVGRLNSDGTQYTSEKTITDALYTGNPFTVEKLGGLRKLVKSEEKLYTQEQVDSQRDYEIYQHLTLCETISFACIILPFLDVDNLIYVDFPEYQITGVYMIDSINFGLKFDSLMNITAHKIYAT